MLPFLFLPETKGRSIEADIKDVMDTNRLRNALRSSSKNRKTYLLTHTFKSTVLKLLCYTEGSVLMQSLDLKMS